MDFIDHDLRALMDEMSKPFELSEVKTLLKQLLSAMVTMHDRWIIHRDLKTSNLLLSNRGELKVADFGLARKLGEPVRGKLTPVVVTLWYRAPEVLLGAPEYGWEVDVWAAGCIFAELLQGKPLFAGKTEPEQIHLVYSLLGQPTERSWPSYAKLPHAAKIAPVNQTSNLLRQHFPSLSPNGLALLDAMLTCDPKRRPSAAQCLKHPFFSEMPFPKDPELFPSWPSKASCERPRRASPSAPHARKFDDE